VAHISRKRWFGAVASLAAAYVLVLNVVLSSLLLAAISPADAAAGYQICHNNPDGTVAPDDAGKTTGKPAAHCPLCTGSHASGAPPAQTVFIATRIALTIAPIAVADDTFITAPANSDHRARAPPRLS
jgi:ABC-type dipeptide/oligopeptide/nickel transport system permease subunit